MEEASKMTLLQAVRASDEVSPTPATAHEAMKRLCNALAEALCIPRSALKTYVAELEAASMENMSADNEFVIRRPEHDKQLSLTAVPNGISPLQIGLLASLVGFYDGSLLSLQALADKLHQGDAEELRTALVGLQAAGYVHYSDDANTLLIRSSR